MEYLEILEQARAQALDPRTNEQTLIILAQDADEQTRYNVAINPSCTDAVLARLRFNDFMYTPENSLARQIQKIAASKLKDPVRLERLSKIPMAFDRDMENSPQALVAKNPYTPEPVLFEMASRYESAATARSIIAARQDVSQRCLEVLARDRDSSVKMAVIQNSKTPRDILESMKVGDAIIRHLVQERLEGKNTKPVFTAQPIVSVPSHPPSRRNPQFKNDFDFFLALGVLVFVFLFLILLLGKLFSFLNQFF